MTRSDSWDYLYGMHFDDRPKKRRSWKPVEPEARGTFIRRTISDGLRGSEDAPECRLRKAVATSEGTLPMGLAGKLCFFERGRLQIYFPNRGLYEIPEGVVACDPPA